MIPGDVSATAPRAPMRSWPEFPLVRKTSGAVLCGREVESSTVTKSLEMKIPPEPSVRDGTLPPIEARGTTIYVHNKGSLSRHLFRGEYE